MRDWNLRVILRQIWAEQGISTGGWSIQRNPSEIDERFWARQRIDILDVALEDWVDAMRRHLAVSAPAVEAGPTAGAARRSPYQGLVPYSEADADWFFGRDEWCEVVGDNLRAYRITVLYGSSGVGKSSVLRAGLMPPARRRGAEQRRRFRRSAAAAGRLLRLESRRSADGA